MRLVDFKNTATLAVLAALATLFSCENNDGAIGPDKNPLLIGKAWVTLSYEIDGEDVELEECDLDNSSVFFNDNTFVDDVGEIVCDEFDTNVEGTWQFKSNQTILSIKPAGEPAQDWQIVELTESTLKLSQYVEWLGGRLTITMEPTNI